MMKRKKQRLYIVLLGLLCLGGAAALVLTAFEDNLVFFYSPSDIKNQQIAENQRMRLGGLVADGSVERSEGERIVFVITDGAEEVKVSYQGILPDLFREGQGVVTEGVMLADGSFEAAEVLAKHDENYMPAEVADALKKSGHWQEEASE